MIFQETNLSRLIIVLIAQPIILIEFLIIAYKVLTRKSNRSTITLSAFYLIMAFGLLMNIIFLLLGILKIEFIINVIYFLSAFSLVFSFIFVLIFINIILDVNYNLKKSFIIIFIDSLILIILYLFPGGINFTEEWLPIYSWSFLVIIYLYFTISITIPSIFYSIKLYRRFEDHDLRTKLKTFLIGIFGMIITVYGAVLFNTWQEPIFKSIWSICVLLLLISSGLLIYYGIGQNL